MSNVLTFSRERNKDLVGGKGYMLGELQSRGINIPNGVILTTNLLKDFLTENGITESLLSEGTNLQNNSVSRIREAIINGIWPDHTLEILHHVYASFEKLGSLCVRSSSVAEDGASASFAGIYRTSVHVRTFGEFLAAVRDCWQSAFDEQALLYVKRVGIPLPLMAVVVQPLVDSYAAGVAFLDNGQLQVSAAYGLGAGVVSGRVPCDTFYWSTFEASPSIRINKKDGCLLPNKSDKPLIEGSNIRVPWKNGRSIVARVISVDERHALFYSIPHPKYGLAEIPVLDEIQQEQLSRYLFETGEKLKETTNIKNWDFEWCLSRNDEVFITQARPLTASLDFSDVNTVVDQGTIKAQAICAGVGIGKAKVISSDADLKKVEEGDVLALDWIPDSYMGVLSKVSGLIIRDGSALSHCAIVSREMRIPCVGGISPDLIQEGQIYKVDGSKGEVSISSTLLECIDVSNQGERIQQISMLPWVLTAGEELYTLPSEEKKHLQVWEEMINCLEPNGLISIEGIVELAALETSKELKDTYLAIYSKGIQIVNDHRNNLQIS